MFFDMIFTFYEYFIFLSQTTFCVPSVNIVKLRKIDLKSRLTRLPKYIAQREPTKDIENS